MGKNDPRDVCNNPGGKERLSGGRRQKTGVKRGLLWGKNICCTNATKNATKFCHIDKLIFRALDVIIHISKNIFYHADSR